METTTDTPTADPAARPCSTCAAPLAGGQDWCLECGSAQPGRLGTRHGWRAAITVVAACGLLATGAGAAAYAALSSEAERVASAPPPPAAAPAMTAPPAQTAPPAPAAETPTVKAPESEPATPPAVATPSPAPAPAPVAPVPSTTEDDPVADEPTPIALAKDSASTYDPYSRGAGGVGDPSDAVDGKESTAWEAPVGDDGSVRIGLAVSLDEARALTRLAFLADTPGFTVEVYGSRAAKLPPDVLDARWENIDTIRDVGVREEVDLKGKYRHVLVWVTDQPADTKVAIPEIQLFD